ncbi:MAG: stage II sporulation protein P [Syntrophomonadaceae bacterium]|nr:stage II sporulation protein P [Syntrophomonadaceae bacterium]
MMMYKKCLTLTVLLTCLLCLSANVALGAHEVERVDGGYYTLVDEEGNVLTKTAHQVYKDDEFIAPDNRRYKVIDVKGDDCLCKYVGQEQMPIIEEADEATSIFGLTPVVARDQGTVGIYSTHSDESYVPSDGTESVDGRGGIYKVSQTLRDKLSSMGINVILDKTIHNPHDINAYSRSRRTASSLLRRGALVLVDVHRDAVPADVYQATVKGQKVTKVKLVVGQQNPHMSANMEFAKRIKAVLDKEYPGLSAGIFVGKGNYNQDLTPRAILIEVGSHTNSKEQALNGVELFSETIPKVMGVEDNSDGVQGTPIANIGSGGSQKSDWTAVIWILLGVAVIYGVYVAINKSKTR